jgi:hypothetical protein|tara:strand:- start:66 stop:659 length:594 start_codon:yes stop_codon:yes gene_type:complete
MKILKIVTFLLFPILSLNAQSEDVFKFEKGFKVGLFIGESTGLSFERTVSEHNSIEFSVGINELFIDDKHPEKYASGYLYYYYGQIYSSSLNWIHQKKLGSNSTLFFRSIIGLQTKLISDVNYLLDVDAIDLPEGTHLINDPITTIDLDFGLNYYVGLGNNLSDKVSITLDMGAYSEILGHFLWTKPQFKLGLSYRL